MFAAAVLLLSCLLTTSGGGSGDAEFDVPFRSSTKLFETHTHLSEDVNAASSASLTSVTFEVVSPAGATLGFLAAVDGYAMVGQERTKVVSLDAAASKGASASLTVEFHGDLRQFFPDGHTLVVQWLVDQNPSSPWPAAGTITVRCRIAVTYTR